MVPLVLRLRLRCLRRVWRFATILTLGVGASLPVLAHADPPDTAPPPVAPPAAPPSVVPPPEPPPSVEPPTEPPTEPPVAPPSAPPSTPPSEPPPEPPGGPPELPGDPPRSDEPRLPPAVVPPPATLEEPRSPDTRLWAPGRIQAYERSLEHPMEPIAILEMPGLGLRVAVFPGTDDLTLDRGAGHVRGTAPPGEDGNVGIAGHRDGFFRVLKDTATGDLLRLVTPNGVREYAVAETLVVEPEQVSVLDPTPLPAVTLVACYPFYFVGHAPRRFIVRAFARPGR